LYPYSFEHTTKTKYKIKVVSEAAEQQNHVEVNEMEITACIPPSTTVMAALEKSPENCTEEEKTAVEFFYRKALVCVEANIASKEVWTASNTYWSILLKDWYFVFATALTLLDRYSSVTNIVENLRRKDSSESDSSKECKRTRARLHTKAEKDAVRNLYFHYCTKFRKMQAGAGAEERMKQWDKLYSPAAKQASKKGAKDRRSIAPAEHRARSNEPSAIDAFLSMSGDFDFLQQTGDDVWGQATSGLREERQMEISNQQVFQM
jgi:hypothetical protein